MKEVLLLKIWIPARGDPEYNYTRLGAALECVMDILALHMSTDSRCAMRCCSGVRTT